VLSFWSFISNFFITKRAKVQEKENYRRTLLGGNKPLLISFQDVLKTIQTIRKETTLILYKIAMFG
jgi:hypothetical protein